MIPPETTAPAGGWLVDTHAHLTDPALHQEVSEIVERARAAGVGAIVCAGYDLSSSRDAVDLARWIPGVWATVGIHPNEVSSAVAADFDAIAALARDPSVVGIGETGLDYYRNRTPRTRQIETLEWHLSLAEELALPAVIHNREADRDTAQLLRASAVRRSGSTAPGVLHCFSSNDADYLDRVLGDGYYISFAGVVTFRPNGSLRDVAARVPVDRLVVETDAPYLAPEPLRGRRNEPAYVRHTADRLAQVRGVPLQTFVAQLWSNSCELFPALARVGVEAAR